MPPGRSLLPAAGRGLLDSRSILFSFKDDDLADRLCRQGSFLALPVGGEPGDVVGRVGSSWRSGNRTVLEISVDYYRLMEHSQVNIAYGTHLGGFLEGTPARLSRGAQAEAGGGELEIRRDPGRSSSWPFGGATDPFAKNARIDDADGARVPWNCRCYLQNK